MSPVLVALVEVVMLFVAFWTTATIPSSGRKWGLRVAAIVVAFILAGAVAADPRAASSAGQYSVYFGIPAIVIYVVARRRR